MVRGHTIIPGGECYRAQNMVQKRDDEVWNLCNFRFICCMDASRCADKL